MDYFLTQLEPGNPHPLLISLHEDEMKIGRSTITSLSKYNKVSRNHASLTKKNESWFITDLKSRNYLYVNLQRVPVDHTVQLNIGDIIGFGSPNVSTVPDGGFICVLTARNKTVKQEPMDDDDDCIEVPIQDITVSCIGASTVEKTSIQFTAAIINDCKLNTEQLHPISCNDLDTYFEKGPEVERANVSFRVNCNTSDVNQIKCADSSAANICTAVRSKESNSDISKICDDPTLETHCPEMSAYPGIEYIDELVSCGILKIYSSNESTEKQEDHSTRSNCNSIQVDNMEIKSNSSTVKKEVHPNYTTTKLNEEYKLKTGTQSGCKSTLKKINKPSTNTLHEFVDEKPILNNYLSTDLIQKPIERNMSKLGASASAKTSVSLSESHFDNSNSVIKNARAENHFETNVGLNNVSSSIKKEKDLRLQDNSSILTNKTDCAKSSNICNEKNNLIYADVRKSAQSVEAARSKVTLKNVCNDKYSGKASKSEQECNKLQLDGCDSTNFSSVGNSEGVFKIFLCKKENMKLQNIPKPDAENSNEIAPNSTLQTHSNIDNTLISTRVNINANGSSTLNSNFDSNFSASIETDTFSKRENPANESMISSKCVIETVGERLSKGFHKQPIEENPVLKTSSMDETHKVIKRKFSHCDDSIRNESRESDRQQKQRIETYDILENTSHSRPFISAGRKSDFEYNHVSKRKKIRDTMNDDSYDETATLIPPVPKDKDTLTLKKIVVLSHGRSKRQCSQEKYPDKNLKPITHNKEQSTRPNQSLKQNRSKSQGRIQLINSKPMEYRPKMRRGREEWFQEKTESTHKKCYNKNAHEEIHRISSNKNSNETTKKAKTEIQKSVKSVSKDSRNSNSKDKVGKEIKLKHSRKYEAYPPKTLDNILGKNDTINAYKIPKSPVRRNSNSCMGFAIDPVSNLDKTNERDERKTFLMQRTGKRQIFTRECTPSTRNLKAVEAQNKIEASRYLSKPISKQTSTTSKIDCSTTTRKQHSFKGYKTFSEEKPENRKRSFDEDLKRMFFNNSEKNNTLHRHRNTSDRSSNLDLMKVTSTHQVESRIESSKKVAIVSPMNKLAKNQNIINETPLSCTIRNENKDFHVCSTALVEMVVSWNTKWLQEQKNNKKPPPLITKDASSLKCSYPSLESYTSSYFPMILLEVWECLFKESKDFLAIEQLQNWNNFCYIIKSSTDKRRLTELNCEAVVSDVLCYQPTKGKIVLLNIKNTNEHKLENYVFGCIRRHYFEELKRGSSEWDYMPADLLQNAKLVKFELLIKKLKVPVQKKNVHLGHGVLNIKDKMQLADALHSFRYSALCSDIFNPQEESLKFCNSSTKIFSRGKLVEEVKEVLNSKSGNKVILLQAPAGTGKTKFATELLQKLPVEKSAKSKILVCAPSYSSLDEILYELVKINQLRNSFSLTNSLKAVRLGEHEKLCSQLQEYSLFSKVTNLYKEDCRKKMLGRECELKSLEEKINELLFKQSVDQSKYRKINKSSTLQALIEKLASLKEKNLLNPMNESFRKGYECIILKESNVLLTTLENSMLPEVRTFLKGDKVDCIVDDATQCSELELLQCLYHPEISKIVLIGDLQQLSPTIHSEYAIKCGYYRSTFERFHLYNLQKYQESLCPSLTEQHRMHSEICQFPSKYFYNNELNTAKGTDEKYSNFPLKPYVVIDILESGIIPEETESSLILYICSLLVQTARGTSIGVIVDRAEKCSVLSWDYEFKDVEVNTLNGFQGREKDVVLVPCLQPFSSSDDFLACRKRLNVAITRAKQCLIICGRISSLVQYPHWRALLDDAMNRNCYLCVASIKHIPLVFENYIKKL